MINLEIPLKKHFIRTHAPAPAPHTCQPIPHRLHHPNFLYLFMLLHLHSPIRPSLIHHSAQSANRHFGLAIPIIHSNWIIYLHACDLLKDYNLNRLIGIPVSGRVCVHDVEFMHVFVV